MDRRCHPALTTLKVCEADGPIESALTTLMRWAGGTGKLDLSFEDLTGITYEHPELRLPDAFRYHTGPLCQWAKRHLRRPGGMSTCALNKYLANRRVQAGGRAIVGSCHMGLTEICRPLCYREQVLGIFYYGSFVLADHADEIREHVARVCHEALLDPADALTSLQAVPVLNSEEASRLERRLAELVRLTGLVLDGLALPADIFRPKNRAYEARVAAEAVPQLVMDALRLMSQHADQPLNLSTIARRLQCHPAHLSRLFRASMSTSVGAYLERIRIDRACKLLRYGRLDITRIAYEVGFTDKSNFGRSFRKLVGTTPTEYRNQRGSPVNANVRS